MKHLEAKTVETELYVIIMSSISERGIWVELNGGKKLHLKYGSSMAPLPTNWVIGLIDTRNKKLRSFLYITYMVAFKGNIFIYRSMDRISI